MAAAPDSGAAAAFPTRAWLQAVLTATCDGVGGFPPGKLLAVRSQQIKRSATGATVHRLHLDWEQGDGNGAKVMTRDGRSPDSTRTQQRYTHAPDSLILKIIPPDWPGDAPGPDREIWFYRRLSPKLLLSQPIIYFAGLDAASHHRLLLLEDLRAYRFPHPTHRWTPAELRCGLRAYAQLHVQGQKLGGIDQEEWLWRPLLARNEETQTLHAVLMHAYEDLVRLAVWSQVAGIELLIVRTLADLPAFSQTQTLLHNDVYPPNIALPADLSGNAILLDWEMAGWGIAELDLAYMFMQPFRSAAAVDRGEALAYYWQQRQALEGTIPPEIERWAIQAHADAVWALSLLPVALAAALRPYPPGSPPQAYWTAMFGVLHERLVALSRASSYAP